MAELEYDDAKIAGILERTETIAMVGASAKELSRLADEFMAVLFPAI